MNLTLPHPYLILPFEVPSLYCAVASAPSRPYLIAKKRAFTATLGHNNLFLRQYLRAGMLATSLPQTTSFSSFEVAGMLHLPTSNYHTHLEVCGSEVGGSSPCGGGKP